MLYLCNVFDFSVFLSATVVFSGGTLCFLPTDLTQWLENYYSVLFDGFVACLRPDVFF